jgi:transcriptional regulator with XRE-family HTH domain
MNLFAKTLSALIESNHGTIREFSRKCGVTFTNISRIVSGDRRCSPAMLRLMCGKISTEPLEKYELLLAHLYDEAESSGLDVSRLSLRHLNGVNLNELDLSPEMNGQLGIIARAAARIPEVAESVESLSGMIARHEALEADRAAYTKTVSPSRGANSDKDQRISQAQRIAQARAERKGRMEAIGRQSAKSSP